MRTTDDVPEVLTESGGASLESAETRTTSWIDEEYWPGPAVEPGPVSGGEVYLNGKLVGHILSVSWSHKDGPPAINWLPDTPLPVLNPGDTFSFEDTGITETAGANGP